MFRVKAGDNLEVLKCIRENSIDAMVTDPPAGIAFMGKDWDRDKGGRDNWIAWMTTVMTASKRALKPGGHCLVWALPRTAHWTAMAMENAGFQIRDVITHLYGSGFPKSVDIAKAIDQQVGKRGGAAQPWVGWGTALKPASEFWIMGRKPISEGTLAANILKWGTGGLNIDKCRVETFAKSFADSRADKIQKNAYGKYGVTDYDGSKGRFPANLILDPDAARYIDSEIDALEGQVSRFFYVPKPTTTERNEGLNGPEHAPDSEAGTTHALFDEDGNATRRNDP
jgi:site-specific DNA-methyltransferase (adenine-specific)